MKTGIQETQKDTKTENKKNIEQKISRNILERQEAVAQSLLNLYSILSHLSVDGL